MTKEKISFLAYFNTVSWRILPAEEKSQHRLYHCTACLQPPHLNCFINLRRNADSFFEDFEKHSTSTERAAFVADHRKQLQAMKLTQTLNNLEHWKSAAYSVNHLLRCSNTQVSLGHTQPKKMKPRKQTPIKPAMFDFDKGSIKQKILASSVSGIKVSWLALSREHPVINRGGRAVSHSHGALVIKTYVQDEGLMNPFNNHRQRHSSQSELCTD